MADILHVEVKGVTYDIASSGGGAVSSVNGQTGAVVLDAEDVGALPDDTVIPSKTSDLTNDSDFITAAQAPVQSVNGQTGAVVLGAADVGALPDNTAIPSKTSDLTNDSNFITAAQAPVQSVNGKTGAVALSASDVNALPDNTAIPSKTSDLTNDSGFITGMEILSYGNSTWADFIAAYRAKKVVYARASSNANPASGTQTRLAFMAYVNNAENPTSVEFQYYRSVSSHSAAQQGDQVFIYTLTSSGWTVTTREAATKIAAGTNMTQSYSNGTLTLNATQPTVPSPSSTAPSMNGTASAGSSTDYARADHVHPTDTSRQAALVSGQNIKTINNESLLGSGNITIQGGGGGTALTDQEIDDAVDAAYIIDIAVNVSLGSQSQTVISLFADGSATGDTLTFIANGTQYFTNKKRQYYYTITSSSGGSIYGNATNGFEVVMSSGGGGDN